MTGILHQPIMVLTDHDDGGHEGYTLTQASRDLLSLARHLTDGPIWAISLTSSPDVPAFSECGVNGIYIPDIGHCSPRIGAVIADAIIACLSHQSDTATLLCHSNYLEREVAGRVAVLLDTVVLADVTDVCVVDTGLQVKKSVFSGSWITTAEVTRSLPVIAVRSSLAKSIAPLTPTTPVIESIPVSVSRQAQAVTVISSSKEKENGQVNLADADVVIAGGRGMDGDFTLVQELADQLGGAVGATRVAFEEGWVSRSIQIGQSGVSVAPGLYIGVGLSGAIHHTVGIQASERIVAICDDPDAPIFEIADFGVVGDLFEVIPQAIETLRSATNQ